MAWMVAQETSRSGSGLVFFLAFPFLAPDMSFFFFWAVSSSFLGSISSSLGLLPTNLTWFFALILASSPPLEY